MREDVLREYFAGARTAAELAHDIVGTVTSTDPGHGPVVRRFRVTRMASSSALVPEHILKLIDAVIAGELSLADLDAIAFALEASDQFEWDTDTSGGERVAHALFWLGSPEVNYPLTPAVLAKIRHHAPHGREHALARGPAREIGTV